MSIIATSSCSSFSDEATLQSAPKPHSVHTEETADGELTYFVLPQPTQSRNWRVFLSGKGVPQTSFAIVWQFLGPLAEHVVDLYRPAGGREFMYLQFASQAAFNVALGWHRVKFLAGQPVNVSPARSKPGSRTLTAQDRVTSQQRGQQKRGSPVPQQAQQHVQPTYPQGYGYRTPPPCPSPQQAYGSPMYWSPIEVTQQQWAPVQPIAHQYQMEQPQFVQQWERGAQVVSGFEVSGWEEQGSENNELSDAGSNSEDECPSSASSFGSLGDVFVHSPYEWRA